MAHIIGFKNKRGKHVEICNACDAVIEFDNSDILRDDMGCEIICPNCGHSIKF